MHLFKFLSALALIPLAAAMPPNEAWALIWGYRPDYNDHHKGGHHGDHHNRHGCPDDPQECSHHCRRKNFDRGVCVEPKGDGNGNGQANYCSCEDDSMWYGHY